MGFSLASGVPPKRVVVAASIPLISVASVSQEDTIYLSLLMTLATTYNLGPQLMMQLVRHMTRQQNGLVLT